MIRRSPDGTAFHRRPQARGKPILFAAGTGRRTPCRLRRRNFPSRGTNCRTAPGPIEEKARAGRERAAVPVPQWAGIRLTASAGGGTAKQGRISGTVDLPGAEAPRNPTRPPQLHGFAPEGSARDYSLPTRGGRTARFPAAQIQKAAGPFPAPPADSTFRRAVLLPLGRRTVAKRDFRAPQADGVYLYKAAESQKNSRSAGELSVMASTLTHLFCRPHIGAGLRFSQDNAPDIVERNIALHRPPL